MIDRQVFHKLYVALEADARYEEVEQAVFYGKSDPDEAIREAHKAEQAWAELEAIAAQQRQSAIRRLFTKPKVEA